MQFSKDKKDGKSTGKKILSRKEQRQNAMKAIYQMSMNEDCIVNELYFETKQSKKEEINNKNIEGNTNIENLKKLIYNFSDEKTKKDFEFEEVSENDGSILYEIIDYNTRYIDLEEYENIDYFKDIVKYFSNNKEEIDRQIEFVLFDKWKINRLSKIDLAILRTALSDISGMQTPYKVAVNEAINLAKKYSDEKSSRFINGVLKEYIKKFIEIEEK